MLGLTAIQFLEWSGISPFSMHTIQRNPPEGKRVLLMATCLCDAFFDGVGRATVETLEHLGCRVLFPDDQTCCGQPAFNSGDWDASRRVVRHTVRVFRGVEPIVTPSGSCAAMVRHGAALEFEGLQDRASVEEMAGRTWELADFIVNGLGVDRWEGRFTHRVAFHRSCHSRGTKSGEAASRLLSSIEGLELVDFGEEEQCCGFGGTFSVGFPNTSVSMGQLKIENVLASSPDFLVSGDMGCLLHLGGLVHKDGRDLPCLHLAEVLRDALRNGNLL